MISRLLLIVAQLPEDPSSLGLPGPGRLNEDTVGDVRNVALAVFGGIALVVMAYAGFKYTMSRGNPQETEKAQNTIVYTLAGLIVAILVTVFISFVVNRLWAS